MMRYIRGRLERHRHFNADDRAAVLALPHALRKLRAHDHLIREGGRLRMLACSCPAFFAVTKIIVDGQRQIVSVHMTGDMANMQNSLLKKADHSVQALTDAEVVLMHDRAACGRFGRRN